MIGTLAACVGSVLAGGVLLAWRKKATDKGSWPRKVGRPIEAPEAAEAASDGGDNIALKHLPDACETCGAKLRSFNFFQSEDRGEERVNYECGADMFWSATLGFQQWCPCPTSPQHKMKSNGAMTEEQR